MLEILTPMNKIERVSRKINAATFVAVPGIWAAVQADGSIANVATNTPALVNKLVIGNASSSQYESHDVSVGRITTVESHGVRIKVGVEGYIGAPDLGDLLYVSSNSTNKGKVASVDDNVEVLSSGTYEVIARVEEVGTGFIIYRTISPSTHTFT